MKARMIKAMICLFLSAAVGGMTVVRVGAEGDISFKDAMEAAISRNGPFYTWTLEEKAALYDQHRYYGEGTRRGVPDDRHIPPEVVREQAPSLLANCFGCDPADLAAYTIDVDFWVEAYPDEDREHEFYSVCFLQVDTADGVPRNAYQMSVSAYSGRVTEAINLETGWSWRPI